jgi:hypothetical protein
MKKLLVASLLLSCYCIDGHAGSSPDCTGRDAYPSAITFVYLKNSGLVDNESTDFSRTKVSRLTSEQIGNDLYRQVHFIQYFRKSGEEVDAIVINEASSEECSMSGADVYAVSKQLGDYKATH